MPSLQRKHLDTLRAIRRKKGVRLFSFTQEILGYADLVDQPHAEMCTFLEQAVAGIGRGTGQTQSMLLVPRGCFKTTIGSVSLPLWLLKENRNLRVLITSRSHEYSRFILDEIKFNAVFKPEFKDLYGDWQADALQWSDEAITLNRSEAHHEPTIDTAGVERPKTGGHYDLIIADDLHDERNSDTEAARARVRRHIQTLWPILEPSGALVVIGTRWHAGDVYGWILDQEAERKRRMGDAYVPRWRTLIRSSHLEDGRLYFPDRLTEKFLEEQKEKIEPKMYAVWYENRPLPDESRIFPEAWWRFFDGQFEAEPVPMLYLEGGGRVNLRVTMSIDPAMSRHNRSDFTAIVVVGVSPEGRWYVLEATRLRGGPVAFLPFVAHCIRTYRPEVLSIETVGFQEMLRIWLMERLAQMNLQVAVREYTESTRHSKTYRIEALQPLFRRGAIYMRRGLTDLYQELREYPEPVHDDLLDALAQHLKIVQPAKVVSSPEELLPPWRPPGQEEPPKLASVGLATQKLTKEE